MPPQALSEEELQLRKRARRRLIGASTLILLSVIFLPMMLDSKPQPLSRDVEIRIPEKNASNFSSSVVAVDGVGSAVAVASGTHNKSGSAVEVHETVIEPPQAPAKPVESAKAAPAAKAEAVKPAEKKASTDKPSEKTAEKPTEKKVEKPAEKKTAADKPQEKAPEHTTAGGTGKFAVQLGVFSSMENAKQLQTKLSGLGFKTYTQQVKGASGEQVRVRMGPYASRNEAEQVRDKLKAKQVNAFVMPL